MPDEIYRDEHMVLRSHRGTRVAIQVGMDPDESRPHIVDAGALVVALNEYLRSEESDG